MLYCCETCGKKYNDYGTFPKLDGEFNKIKPFEGLFQFIF